MAPTPSDSDFESPHFVDSSSDGFDISMLQGWSAEQLDLLGLHDDHGLVYSTIESTENLRLINEEPVTESGFGDGEFQSSK
jgi:hypothetical protein